MSQEEGGREGLGREGRVSDDTEREREGRVSDVTGRGRGVEGGS